jgi:tetratricopeptide (TPR) repeat protein
MKRLLVVSVALAVCSTAALAQDVKKPGPEAVKALERGNEALDKGDLDASIGAYTEAIKLEPSWAWAYCKRGQAHMNKQDYAKAIADCDKALQIEPRLMAAHAFRAASQCDGKDYAAAIASATQALKLEPKAHFFWFLRGTARYHKGALDDAIADLTEAINLDSKNTQYYNNRGMAYEKRGDTAKAKADYNRREELTLAGMSPAKRQAYQDMLQAEARFRQVKALFEAESRSYELMRNSYLQQAGRAAASGVRMQPPTAPDGRLQQQLNEVQAAYVQARRIFEQTP